MEVPYQESGRAVDEQKVERHARIPMSTIWRIPGEAARVYCALLAHRNDQTGRCDPSIETLAQVTRMRRSNVQRALKNLKNGGLIEWQTLGRGRARYCKYKIDLESEANNEASASSIDLVCESNLIGNGIKSRAVLTSDSSSIDLVCEAQTTKNNDIEQNDDVPRPKNGKEKDGARSDLASRLREMFGFSNKQAQEAADVERVALAERWLAAGVPSGKSVGFVVSAIRNGWEPEPSIPARRRGSDYLERNGIKRMRS